MQGHETRSELFKVSVDLTRTRYLFLETAEGLIEKKLNISFVYADIYWSLGIKFKNGSFKCFNSLNELHSLSEVYEVSVIEIFEFQSVLVYDIGSHYISRYFFVSWALAYFSCFLPNANALISYAVFLNALKYRKVSIYRKGA